MSSNKNHRLTTPVFTDASAFGKVHCEICGAQGRQYKYDATWVEWFDADGKKMRKTPDCKGGTATVASTYKPASSLLDGTEKPAPKLQISEETKNHVGKVMADAIANVDNEVADQLTSDIPTRFTNVAMREADQNKKLGNFGAIINSGDEILSPRKEENARFVRGPYKKRETVEKAPKVKKHNGRHSWGEPVLQADGDYKLVCEYCNIKAVLRPNTTDKLLPRRDGTLAHHAIPACSGTKENHEDYYFAAPAGPRGRQKGAVNKNRFGGPIAEITEVKETEQGLEVTAKPIALIKLGDRVLGELKDIPLAKDRRAKPATEEDVIEPLKEFVSRPIDINRVWSVTEMHDFVERSLAPYQRVMLADMLTKMNANPRLQADKPLDLKSKLNDALVLINVMFEELVKNDIAGTVRQMAGRFLFCNGYDQIVNELENG